MATANAAWNIWNFRRPVIEALLSDGHTVTLLVPQDDTVPRLEELGCPVVALSMDRKGLNPLRDLGLLRRMRAAFAEQRPDVVISYTIKNNLYGAVAARSLGIAFIPNVSGLGTAFLSGTTLRRLAEVLYRVAFARLQTVFFQNTDDRDYFVERRLIRASQAHVLRGSGIDLERFSAADYPDPDAPPTFLMIARLLRDKGVHEFVEAARIVKGRRPEARFQLLGAAGAKNRSAVDRATVAAWEQSGAIEYLGTCEDVREHIAQAHCVVLPSYREGAPRTLIEAAAMARPVIATDVPGCRSVVNDGENGYLCDVRSSQSLAEVCLRFLGLRRDEQMALGRAGRKKMERQFDQAQVIAAYREAITYVAPAATGRRRAGR